jgi:hypothetical protein
MRRAALLIVLLLAVAMPATAIAQGRTQTAPHAISAMLGGTFTFIPFGPGYYDVYNLGVTSGEVHGLGQTNLFTFQMPNAEAPGSFLFTHFFLVAANGDKITGTYNNASGVPGGPGIILTATFVITGGTGRFAHATGTLDATAYVTVLNAWEWPVVWELNGTIEY